MIAYTNNTHRSIINNILGRLSASVKEPSSILIPSHVFDSLSQGVVVFNATGTEVYRNACAQTLIIEDDGIELFRAYQYSETGTYKLPTQQQQRVNVRVTDFQGGYLLVAEPSQSKQSPRSQALSYLQEHTDEDSIYRRAARALGLSSGWRWIGISQYLDPTGTQVRFLGWWDAHSCKPSFNASTVETPCHTVAVTEQFCFYAGADSLQQRFPNWALAESIGVKAYAGLVYHVNGKAKGHVMALSDTDAVSPDAIEDLLTLSATYLSVSLERSKLSSSERCAPYAVSTRHDRLTGLGNKVAYKAHKQHLLASIERGELDEAVVVTSNLDDLHKINLTHDYSVGDQYIQRYAQLFSQHWRCSNYLFRLSGDEFILIMPGVTPKGLSQLEKICALINSVLMEQFGHQASHGISFLSEHEGSLERTIQGAEIHMYEQKAQHKIHQRQKLQQKSA